MLRYRGTSRALQSTHNSYRKMPGQWEPALGERGGAIDTPEVDLATGPWNVGRLCDLRIHRVMPFIRIMHRKHRCSAERDRFTAQGWLPAPQMCWCGRPRAASCFRVFYA